MDFKGGMIWYIINQEGSFTFENVYIYECKDTLI